MKNIYDYLMIEIAEFCKTGLLSQVNWHTENIVLDTNCENHNLQTYIEICRKVELDRNALQRIIRNMEYVSLFSLGKTRTGIGGTTTDATGIIPYLKENVIDADRSELTKSLFDEAISEIKNNKQPITVFTKSIKSVMKIHRDPKIKIVYSEYLTHGKLLFMTMNEVKPVFTTTDDDRLHPACMLFDESNEYINPIIHTMACLDFGKETNHCLIKNLSQIEDENNG